VSLAEEHFERYFGVPQRVDYTTEEARDFVRGRSTRDEAKEHLYAKMLQLCSILVADSLSIKRNSSQLVIRSLPDGESSASVTGFADGSFFIRVSTALLDAVMSAANMAVMFEHRVAATSAFTRRGRRRQAREAAIELSAAFRAWIILQRVSGMTQSLSFNLAQADTEAAGAIALDALQFVLSHEVAHIALKHTDVAAENTIAAGHISHSQSQELQADNLAVRFIRGERPGQAAVNADPMWGVFLALLATELTESAIYIRRNSTHPLAWARWAVLDKLLGGGEGRSGSYQGVILMAAVEALKLDDTFPAEGWDALQRAQTIAVGSADLVQLDRLLTAPVDRVARRAHATSSPRGREVLTRLRDASLADALSMLRATRRYVQAVTDDRWAVSFFTIKSLIESECINEALNPDSLLFSVAGTRMVARLLAEGARSRDG
jgi:Peptidase U49